MIELLGDRIEILNNAGNMLIMGGPGSGKTTIGLLKASFILESKMIKPYQKILFLSFANATISRIRENLDSVINAKNHNQLYITTYHSFAWELLKSHGYLLNGRNLKILTPSQANARLSTIEDKQVEKNRLFNQEGLIHFDLFANKCTELLKNSNSILKIISDTFPIVILDEFQDTNQDEWEFIQELGRLSTLIALADPNQRIYDFRGANPLRIAQFRDRFNPTVYDFKKENNRSNGTDICEYGNDILTGSNIGKEYNDVKVVTYGFRKNNMHLLSIKYYILNSIKDYTENLITSWSIAIIVPTNTLMIEISEFLNNTQVLLNGKTVIPISHNISVDMSGPTIVASMFGTLLDESSRKKNSIIKFTKEVARYLLGRNGERMPSQVDIELAKFLNNYSENRKVNGKNRIALIEACNKIVNDCNNLVFSGDVGNDWRLISNTFNSIDNEIFKKIYLDSKFIKLLHKGSFLNSRLGSLWKKNGNYEGASEVVENALTQEHFSTTTKSWEGVSVMTIHKAKGKEFTQVIIFEGRFPGKRYIFSAENINQARLNLRVAVTRAREKSYILTPDNDPCPLLVNRI